MLTRILTSLIGITFAFAIYSVAPDFGWWNYLLIAWLVAGASHYVLTRRHDNQDVPAKITSRA